MPHQPEGFTPDWQREARVGVSEAVLCPGKTTTQIERIVAMSQERRHSLLLTNLDASRFAELGPIAITAAHDVREALLG